MPVATCCWRTAGSNSSQGLGFEAVYDGGLDADIWLIETFRR